MSDLSKKRTGRGAMCAYGMADIYGGGAFVVISTFFTVFLTKALGMPTALAGTIPLVGKIWDAITDPIMGNIVDRTRSRFGAKRFYILLGSIISALTFACLWLEFTGGSLMQQYVFYMFMYILFSTGFTIVMVPYNALLPDMVEDYQTRGRFTGIRMIFSSLGAIIAGLIPTIMIQNNTDPHQYFIVALLFAVIFLVAILITFFGTWEKSHEPKKEPFGRSMAQSFTVFRNKTYLIFIAIFLCGQGAADFVTGMAVFYVDDVLNAYGGGNFTILMGVILAAQFLGMFIMNPLMNRTDKTMPIKIGFPVRIVATLVLLFFSYEGVNFVIILVLSFIIGLGMAASSVSIYAILADMPDVDELIYGKHRPGVCSSMATFVRKIATGLSSAIIGVLMAFVGYNEVLANEGLRQAASTQHGIALIYVIVPVILMVLTLILTWRFPLGKQEFEIVKQELARRRGEAEGEATPEERRVCEKVTGLPYERLWNNGLGAGDAVDVPTEG
ncbi:MAG: MFS transporter [Coriobacteriales bacterium]|nr:MFS transporter [Coriobacteriales bacterium]MBQ6585328.1 MFS transporter [Coriobacteriales bacterium]